MEARLRYQEKFGLPNDAAYILVERGKFKRVRVLTHGTVAILNKRGTKLIGIVRFLNRGPNDPHGPSTQATASAQANSPSPTQATTSAQPNPPSPTQQATAPAQPNPQVSQPTTITTKPCSASYTSTSAPSHLPNQLQSSQSQSTHPLKRQLSPSSSSGTEESVQPEAKQKIPPSPSSMLGTKESDHLDQATIQMWHDWHLCIRILYMLATRRGMIHQNSAMKLLGELIQGPMWGVGWRSSAAIGKQQKGSKIGMSSADPTHLL